MLCIRYSTGCVAFLVMAIFSLIKGSSVPGPASDIEQGLSRLYDDLVASQDEAVTPAPDSLRESLFQRIDNEPARVSTDENGLITATNPAFSRLCGYSFQEIRGKKPGTFLHGPLTEPEVVDQIRQALASRQPIQIELTNYHKDGSPYRVRISIVPRYREGRFDGFDAEERRVAQE
ncbi:MAG: hypothetical protein Fur0032_15390 [Terrimicrobiaceae bacterium]